MLTARARVWLVHMYQYLLHGVENRSRNADVRTAHVSRSDHWQRLQKPNFSEKKFRFNNKPHAKIQNMQISKTKKQKTTKKTKTKKNTQKNQNKYVDRKCLLALPQTNQQKGMHASNNNKQAYVHTSRM